MVKTVSSNDAKQRWGTVLADVSERGDTVIVESHGKAKAVVVPVGDYEELIAYREQRRRADALERLRRLSERIAERNARSTETEEERIEFAVELGREINAAAADRWRESLGRASE